MSHDRAGSHVCSSEPFYYKSRPPETYGERFDAYLHFLAKYRPYGLVEVTLVLKIGQTYNANDEIYCLEGGEIESFEVEDAYFDDDDYDRSYQEDWVPYIEDRGFKCVTVVPNTNSGNLVHVYHLVMDGEWHRKYKATGKSRVDLFAKTNNKEK
jgi:hypothetical protein